MNKRYLIGNWKMNFDLDQTRDFLLRLEKELPEYNPAKLTVVVCPPYTDLALANDVLKSTSIKVGAQNVHHQEKGQYTGEVASSMLHGLASYVLIGHSERRRLSSETDKMIRSKVEASLKGSLTPIILVGESRQKHHSGHTEEALQKQLETIIGKLPHSDLKRSILVYEPVWAISPQPPASADEAAAGARTIRQYIEKKFDPELAASIPVLYGGSSNQDNVLDFVNKEEIDGVVAGSASIDVEDFTSMIKQLSQ